MKVVNVFLFGLLCMLGSITTQAQIVVDPNAKARELKDNFSVIKVTNGIDVVLSQSNEIGLAVSASDPRFIDKIITTVENGVLKIFYDKQAGLPMTNRKLKVYISCIDLSKIDASGGSDITVLGTLKSKNLNLKLAGASDFKGRVEADNLDMNISGASDVNISGAANVLNLDNSGASDFRGYDLVVNTCNTKSSGASDVAITVTKELNVHASGASDVNYRGEPAIKTIRTSGASSVSKRD